MSKMIENTLSTLRECFPSFGAFFQKPWKGHEMALVIVGSAINKEFWKHLLKCGTNFNVPKNWEKLYGHQEVVF